jgi:hypothetical protein
MHEHFANWYRLATVEPKAEILEKRWQGIEKFAATKTPAKVLELVRLFYQLPQQDDEIIAQYKTAFKNEDAAFLTKDNDLELQVLAASSLMHLLIPNRPSTEADVCALAIMTCLCQGLRKEIILPDVITYAHQYISSESIRVREYSDLTQQTVKPKELDKSFAALKTAIDGALIPSLKDPLTSIIEHLQKTQNEFINTTQNNLKELEKALSVQSEESNVQWWLFGEFSRDLKIPFKDLKLPGACLIIAKELADLTLFLPTAHAAEAFLHKALFLVSAGEVLEKTNIANTINSVRGDWKNQIIQESDFQSLKDLCPLHFALRKSGETSKPSDWIASFEKTSNLKSKENLSPVSLALQFYYERMLLRA